MGAAAALALALAARPPASAAVVVAPRCRGGCGGRPGGSRVRTAKPGLVWVVVPPTAAQPALPLLRAGGSGPLSPPSLRPPLR